MHCPRCSDVALPNETIDGLSVRRCPKCHGIWFEPLELERILSLRPRKLLAEDRAFAGSKPGEPARLNCPACQGTYLIKVNSRIRRGTLVDSCTVCYGTWLDAGELTRLARRDFFTWLKSLFGGGAGARRRATTAHSIAPPQ